MDDAEGGPLGRRRQAPPINPTKAPPAGAADQSY
jgi:hypothetical protein